MKQNKEQEILKAAEDLFAEKGFKGATTTLIASRAGVTHAVDSNVDFPQIVIEKGATKRGIQR